MTGYESETIKSLETRVGGGHSKLFFSDKGVQSKFLKCEACEPIIVSEREVLWTDFFFNLGACELNFEIEVVKAKISNFFSQKEGLWTDFCLKWDPHELQELSEKGFLGMHIPVPPDCTTSRYITKKQSLLNLFLY